MTLLVVRNVTGECYIFRTFIVRPWENGIYLFCEREVEDDIVVAWLPNS